MNYCGHMIVKATIPNSKVRDIFEDYANFRNKVKTVLLLEKILCQLKS